MRIAIDCDEAGLPLKPVLADHLRAQGVAVTDLNYQQDHPWIIRMSDITWPGGWRRGI
jgi:ribose 5-phosphate isomerase RpiB